MKKFSFSTIIFGALFTICSAFIIAGCDNDSGQPSLYCDAETKCYEYTKYTAESCSDLSGSYSGVKSCSTTDLVGICKGAFKTGYPDRWNTYYYSPTYNATSAESDCNTYDGTFQATE